MAFSHHPKVLLAQKKFANFGIPTPLHEQIPLDSTLLHHFFTKQSYDLWERYCAVKYILHTQEKHSSYQLLQYHDNLFINAMRLHIDRTARKKLYTHTDLFEAVAQNNITSDQHIILWDKEWLFDNWKKRRYKPYDLYTIANSLDALVYKYSLLQSKKSDMLQEMYNRFLIFLGIWEGEATAFFRDYQQENLQVDNLYSNLTFRRTSRVRERWKQASSSMFHHLDPQDAIIIEKQIEQLDHILTSPFILQYKWGQRQDRFTIQPLDTYTERADIIQFFDAYKITILSVLDKNQPQLQGFPLIDKLKIPLQRWKDIKVSNTPKICIIAPSKQAAQQLIISLHKSDAYKDCFLAAEHITGGAGKIIQQTT